MLSEWKQRPPKVRVSPWMRGALVNRLLLRRIAVSSVILLMLLGTFDAMAQRKSQPRPQATTKKSAHRQTKRKPPQSTSKSTDKDTTQSGAATTNAIPVPSSPTKEYIYAGGKLIATEEPANNPAPAISSLSPTSGSAGTSVTVTGSNFTGASSVTFNGTSASSFTVNSSTQITATVPTGATTGLISLTTAGGTL